MIAYETFTIQAASLAVNEISSHIIATNIHNFGYYFYIGISVVTYLNVSKYLLNNKKVSIQYIKYGAGFLTIAVFCSFIFLVFAPWTGIFTKDDGVIGHLTTLTPFLVVYMILDSVQTLISSVSRAVGEHYTAFKHFIISFFFVGQPLCFFLKFALPGQGLTNIWISMIMSIMVYNLWQGKLLWSIDLKEAARKME